MDTPSLQQRLEPRALQVQRLLMLPQMQQSLRLLQMPNLELAEFMKTEMELNPAIEPISDESDEFSTNEEDLQSDQELSFNENDLAILDHLDTEFYELLTESEPTTYSYEEKKHRLFQENNIIQEPTLFEFVFTQAKEAFSNPNDLAIAEEIIGCLDSQGYVTCRLEEISIRILQIIQTFDPPGIAARSLQECLLIQLRRQGKENSLAAGILSECYEDLIHNRRGAIQKKLKCTAQELVVAIQKDLRFLDFHPGLNFRSHNEAMITPDILIQEDDNQLRIQLNEEDFPSFHFRKSYLNLIHQGSLDPDTRRFLREKIASAKWLFRSIEERKKTILNVVTCLTKHQRAFFKHTEGNIVPLTMQRVAEDLGIHESTVARAINGKYLSCAKGVFPLRFFFSRALGKENASAKSAQKILRELIHKENKKAPLSDEALSKHLSEKGIPCARRTVAKYRNFLKIGNAQQRKQ